MAEKRIDFVVNAKDNASSTFQKIGRELDLMKQQLGKRSDFGEMLDLLRGGGAAAGLAMAGQALNQMVQAATRLRTEMAQGQKAWGDVVEETAASIPIYGQIIQAGRGIRELWTGAQAAATAILETTKAIDAAVAGWAARQKLVAGYMRESELALRSAGDEMLAGGMGEPLKTLFMNQAGTENRSADIRYETEQRVKELRDTSSKQVAGLLGRRSELEGTLQSLWRRGGPQVMETAQADEIRREIAAVQAAMQTEQTKAAAAIAATRGAGEDRIFANEQAGAARRRNLLRMMGFGEEDTVQGYATIFSGTAQRIWAGLKEAGRAALEQFREKNVDRALDNFFGTVEQNVERREALQEAAVGEIGGALGMGGLPEQRASVRLKYAEAMRKASQNNQDALIPLLKARRDMELFQLEGGPAQAVAPAQETRTVGYAMAATEQSRREYEQKQLSLLENIWRAIAELPKDLDIKSVFEN